MRLSAQRYVSKELTHFVGRTCTPDEQFELLVKILREGWLSHPPHDPYVVGNLMINRHGTPSSNDMFVPQMVCFCDIPVEDLHLHATKYSAFGLALDKDFVIAAGGCPVFYVPTGARVTTVDFSAYHSHSTIPDGARNNPTPLCTAKGPYFDRMLTEYHEQMHRFMMLLQNVCTTPGVSYEEHRLHGLRFFLEFQLFANLKLFDHTLGEEDLENFYFEREWRVIGNVHFRMADVKRVLFPSGYAKRFRDECPEYYGQVTFMETT